MFVTVTKHFVELKLCDVHRGAGVVQDGLSCGQTEGKLQLPLTQVFLPLGVSETDQTALLLE